MAIWRRRIWWYLDKIDLDNSFKMSFMKCLLKKRKRNLRSGESNPGRPRDRRKYLTTILLRICKRNRFTLYETMHSSRNNSQLFLFNMMNWKFWFNWHLWYFFLFLSNLLFSSNHFIIHSCNIHKTNSFLRKREKTKRKKELS